MFLIHRMITEMNRLFLQNWYSVLLTAILGPIVYFVIYWLRLKKINKERAQDQQLTLQQLIEDDWSIIITSMRRKELEKKQIESKKEIKPQMRRGGSSGNLAASGNTGKSKLKKQQSLSGKTLRISNEVL